MGLVSGERYLIMDNPGTFPKRDRLWRGAIMGTIAHAIWVAQYPDFDYEQTWDGTNYSLQDTEGARGTIVFTDDALVGVFFDSHSPRNPFPFEMDATTNFDIRNLFVGMPPELDLLLEEALQYVLAVYRGETAPIITAAFWSMGEELAACEPWLDVMDNGAHLVRIQVLDTDAAIAEWREYYDLTSAQIDLLHSIFERKMANPRTRLVLESWERDIINGKDTEGAVASHDIFAQIGIY
jgi:hypothetical protein